jgi:probable ribonuclease FAU-1
MRARVRGIYTTALTHVLVEAGHDVVQVSEPIRERFDREFAHAVADCDLGTTEDRQGVEVSGDPDAVATASALVEGLGIDTLAWEDPLARGTVVEGVVRRERGRGAVVDCGDREGFLPFESVDGYVEVGDRLRVQVAEPTPPWSDREPKLTGEIGAGTPGGLVRLVAGRDGVVDAPDRETAGLVDLLDDPPEGWGIALGRGAEGASLETLSEALSVARERALAVDDALERESNEGEVLAAPHATVWCWFGRESRFALDEVRREVTGTMAGHHRVKAGSERASGPVDFVEALCPAIEEFPFGVVVDQFGPGVGDALAIEHGKPDGRLITLGRGEVVEVDPEGSLVIRREMTAGGTYDALSATREEGDVALTTLSEGRWWYATVYRSEKGVRKGTYVNVCTPVELFPAAARYVDLHVDVVKHADGRVERVDDEELDAAVRKGNLNGPLADRARDVAASIERALS